MPPDGYSGGRYAVVMMAEALALAGHDVYLITNNRPAFLDDFAAFPGHARVHLCLTPDFSRELPEGPFDFAIYVPSTFLNKPFHYGALLFALRRRARLVLVNFESGNWFNALSPAPRDITLWDPWRQVARWAVLVLSNAKEGERWARDFYRDCRKGTKFDWCFPAINTLAADSIEECAREPRIVVFTRFAGSEHKGSRNLMDLLCPAMRGYTLVLVVGTGAVQKETLEAIRGRAAELGIGIEVKEQLSDLDKFRELKRAALVLFPSYFEGYGYPPVEAQYCDVPCIAFDLPVLREVSGERLIYARHGDWADFRSRIEEVLAGKHPRTGLREAIRASASIETEAAHLTEILHSAMGIQPPRPVLRGIHFAWWHCNARLSWTRMKTTAAGRVLRRVARLFGQGPMAR